MLVCGKFSLVFEILVSAFVMVMWELWYVMTFLFSHLICLVFTFFVKFQIVPVIKEGGLLMFMVHKKFNLALLDVVLKEAMCFIWSIFCILPYVVMESRVKVLMNCSIFSFCEECFFFNCTGNCIKSTG